jgi:heterokaryon incompatibility protein (HET)
MRLLNCRTKKLEEFIGSAIPHYAILSHTWEDEEVLFNDIAQDNVDYKAKRGWYKIEKSCEQSLRDGLNYVWADTVCIDKSSSAELSEAINSMFKWYRNSTICYAYLCDLPEFDLEESRWFTRGWTLQEMIAPKELWFYDRNWAIQGSKSALLEKLQDITGVDITALRGGSLRFFSVAKKMSWASKRQTIREEDIAYCLLGVFDISMPLLYGEGSKAFIRFQEEIIKEYDDESLFAWRSTTLGHTSGLLAPSPAAFSLSANIVPCLTRAPMPTISAPITVTSRGIRLEAPVEKFDEAKATYLIRLNCKPVSFERSNGIRVGIIVAHVQHSQGYPSSVSIYGRIHPDRFHLFLPNHDLALQPVFLLKENHLQYFDLATYYVLLVRNMPRWPPGSSYRLVLALPSEAWEEKNATFRRLKLDKDDHPFVLVFRRDAADSTFYDHFIIAFHHKAGTHGGRIWCDAVFRRVNDIEDLDLAREVQLLRREVVTVEIEGGGTALKCQVRSEIISGQRIYCADLLAKSTNGSSTIL